MNEIESRSTTGYGAERTMPQTGTVNETAIKRECPDKAKDGVHREGYSDTPIPARFEIASAAHLNSNDANKHHQGPGTIVTDSVEMHIRRIPRPLWLRLRHAALAHGTSLRQFVIDHLQQIVAETAATNAMPQTGGKPATATAAASKTPTP